MKESIENYINSHQMNIEGEIQQIINNDQQEYYEQKMKIIYNHLIQ